MTPSSPITIIAWDRAGRLKAQFALETHVVSVSAAADDGDVHLPGIGTHPHFFQLVQGRVQITISSGRGRPKKIVLKLGVAKRLGDFYWMAIAGEVAQAIEERVAAISAQPPPPASETFLGRALKLISMPMDDLPALTTGLGGLIELIVSHTVAESAVLVMFEGEHAKLVAWDGLSHSDAHKLWNKLPAHLARDILRQGARLVLPEELTRQASRDSTVFIRGVESISGFPILAEKRVMALLIVGFRNIITDLTEDLENVIECIASLTGLVIQRALLREQMVSHAEHLARSTSETSERGPARLMIGESRAIELVYQLIRKLAPTRVPVLLHGETGSGKELAARELHRFSARTSGPFVPVNAAALPENLIESELFGHAKGAFTGAISHRTGLIEQAHGGTLFIDEIGELPLALQAKLLRVLQERSVQRLGENHARPVDFRLVTATNRQLREMTANGSFREDLYYRISGATIDIPPLRERRGDILLLANYFKSRFTEFHGLPAKDWSREAIQGLLAKDWKGNVRELENTVERALIMADGPVVRLCDLGLAFADEPSNEELGWDSVPITDNLDAARDAFLRRHLIYTLEKYSWNKKAAARALGIGLRTLFRHIEQLDITKESPDASIH